jgi:hypothetical protein
LTKKEHELLVSYAQLEHVGLVTGIESIAIYLHVTSSPTSWLLITPEQRNTSRRRANEVINEALYFWDSEVRKRAPQ